MAKTPRSNSTPLPSGTLTFLFTDIEGSTALWEAHHEAMRRAVARHDELMRQCIAARGGHVFKTVGDAFCAAFSTAPQALSAALAVQQAMQAEPWPQGLPIRVRVALHTGAAELRDADYFGAPLNHVARLLAVAHGGQTLLTEIAHDLCRDRLPVGSALKPLGEHGLKDLARREVVFELSHPGLPSSFPPLRTVAGAAPKFDDTPSIAVLPFVNMSRDEENEYFADGLSEELLNVLTNIRGLRVPSRTSAFYFKGKDVDLATIAQKLNVATILEGSVRRSGKRVRITAQLVHVATDSHLWSKTYDRELDDIFAVQDDIAHSVVSELRAGVLGGTDVAAGTDARAEVRAAAKGRAANADAYQLYLQARFFEERPTPEDIARALDYYRQALQIDPAYALAWAGTARANANHAAYYALNVNEGFHRAREAAERALQLDPELAEAHEALGRIQMWHDWDWTAADASFQRALNLAPNNVHVIRSAAQLTGCLGRLDEAIRLLRRATALDPLSAPVQRSLTSGCLGAGDLVGAEAAAMKGIELNPKGDLAHAWLAVVRLHQGRLEEALSEVEQETSDVFRLHSLAMIHHARGDSAASDAALAELTDTRAAGAALQIAEAHAWRGDADAAFEWLERAYAQRDAGLPTARISVPLRKVHDDLRWLPFMKKLKLDY